MANVYKAKWILTASDGDYAPVYEDCAIIVEDGKISDILPQSEIYDEVFETVEDFGNAIITPGFVNLSANLQYKNLPENKKFFVKVKQFFSMIGVPLENYAMKLADIEAQFMSLNKNQRIEIFKENLKQELLSGTTCFAQNLKADKTGKICFEILNKIPIKTILMLEIYADSVKKSNKIFHKIKKAYKFFKKEKNDSTYFGLNPKSVWQVHKKLWRFLGKYAKHNKLILMTELLESKEEIEWVNEGFSYLDYYNKFLGNKKIPYEKRLSPVEYLKELRVLGENTVVKGGNYLSSRELQTLAEKGVKMAFSAATVHKDEIILRYFSKQFGLTNEISSKSILEELFSLRLSINVEELIKYITIYPAKILGIDNITGSLEYNKHADFNVFKLDKKQNSINDLRYNLKPYAVYILGKQIVRDGEIIYG